jgi:TP901 family phage tail tape measure protein
MAVTVSELRAFVGMNDADFQKGIKEIKSALESVAAEGNTQGMKLADALEKASVKAVASFETLSKKAIAVGKTLSVAVTAPLALLGKKAIDIAGTFEQNMNILQATSQATGAQMAAFSKLSIQLGNDITLPATSAADAAKAMLELKKAGLDVNDVMAAAKPTLQLAAIGQIDVAVAAHLVSDALNQFGLHGDQATRIADLFAASSIAAGGSVEQMGEALKTVAPEAKLLGLNINDTTILLSMMAKEGKRGEFAGTALKTAFMQLTSPTKQARDLMKSLHLTLKDATDQFLPAREMVLRLNKALSGLSEGQRAAAEDTLVGSHGIQALSTIVGQGAAGFDAMAKKVNEQGAAARLATAMNKGLKGAMDAMASAFETAAQAGIQPVIKDLTSMAKAAGTLIGKFADLPEGTRRFIVEALAAAAALGPLILGIVKVTEAVNTLKAAILAARAGEGIKAWLASGPVLLAIGLIIAAIVALYLAWTQNWGHIREVTFDAMNTIVSAFETFSSGISDIWNGALNALSGEWKEGWEQIKRGSSNALHALSIGAQKAGEERARMDQQQADAAVARTKATVKAQQAAAKDAARGGGTFNPTLGGDSEGAKQLKKFNEELADTIIKLTSAKRGESKVQQDLLAQYPLVNAAMRQSLINKREELDKINRVQEATKRFKEELTAVKGRIAALKGGQPTIIADLAKQFPGVNQSLLQHLANLTQWARHLEINRQKVQDLEKTIKDMRLEYELMGADPKNKTKPLFTPEQVFTANLYHRSLTAITDKEKERAKGLFKDKQAAEFNTIIWNKYTEAQDNWRLSGARAWSQLSDINNALIVEAQNSAAATTAWELFGVALDAVDDDARDAIVNLTRANEKLAATKQLKEGFQSLFTDAFKNVNQGFAGFFKSILAGVDQLLQEMAAKFLAARVTELLFHLIPGGTGFLEGIIAGGTVGGGKAVGGRFDAGEHFLVGEHGPELVGFDKGGSVMRNSELREAAGGGRGNTMIQNIYVQDGPSVHRSASSIRSDGLRMLEAARRKDLK